MSDIKLFRMSGNAVKEEQSQSATVERRQTISSRGGRDADLGAAQSLQFGGRIARSAVNLTSGTELHRQWLLVCATRDRGHASRPLRSCRRACSQSYCV
jgi:hypothetical protein